jgi:ssDNA-binding Zn-finger/Zn-ribbon topoisomerase 1
MGRAATLGAAYREAHGLRARAFAPRAGGAGGAAGGEETSTKCDRCGEATYRKIARKKGRGSFLACPACRMMRNVRAKVRAGACPTCGSALIEKSFGKGPAFWGCVRYGAAERPCTYRESADGKARPAGAARYTRAATDKGCPRCGKAKLAIVTPIATGADAPGAAPFYACDDAACRFTLPLGARRRKAPCPACGAVVLERRRKPGADGAPGAPFWACARWPECTHTAAFTAPAPAPASG